MLRRARRRAWPSSGHSRATPASGERCGGRLLKDQTVGVVMRVGFSGPHACGAALLHLHPARLRPVALTLDNIQAKKGMLNVLGDVGSREI